MYIKCLEVVFKKERLKKFANFSHVQQQILLDLWLTWSDDIMDNVGSSSVCIGFQQ